MDKDTELTEGRPTEIIEKTVFTSEKFLKVVELTAMGIYDNKQVYEMAGVSRATFYRWKQTQEFIDAVSSKEILIFKGLVGKAVSKINTLMDSENEKIQLEAARTVLDKSLPDFQGKSPPPSAPQVLIKVSYE